MLNRIKYILVSALMGVLFWNCTETREVGPELYGLDYFPLNVGDYRIYQVKNVKYYAYNDSAVTSYQLKENVVESFPNLEGGISYKIQFESKDEAGIWEVDSVWTARIEENRAILVESNIPVIKMVFPLRNSLSWDANGLNTLETDEFEMVNIDMSFETDLGEFENTITVVQEDFPENVVDHKSRFEVYSKNIGLSHKEYIDILYAQGELLGKMIPNQGIIYHKTLIDHGQE